MRTPKPPIGFVPVDSEEAKGIEPQTLVNAMYMNNGKWYTHDSVRIESVRVSSQMFVQLPPKVEWEEVWGWQEEENGRTWISCNGVPFETIGNRAWSKVQLDTIVRVLNEMEGRDG